MRFVRRATASVQTGKSASKKILQSLSLAKVITMPRTNSLLQMYVGVDVDGGDMGERRQWYIGERQAVVVSCMLPAMLAPFL